MEFLAFILLIAILIVISIIRELSLEKTRLEREYDKLANLKTDAESNLKESRHDIEVIRQQRDEHWRLARDQEWRIKAAIRILAGSEIDHRIVKWFKRQDEKDEEAEE